MVGMPKKESLNYSNGQVFNNFKIIELDVENRHGRWF
jgi:hypothetical protein